MCISTLLLSSVLFLATSINWLSPSSTSSFLFSWRRQFKVRALAILSSFSVFLGLFHEHMLLKFCLESHGGLVVKDSVLSLLWLVLNPWPRNFCVQRIGQRKKKSKVPKNKTWFCYTRNYLHSIYIVLGIISNLEMIYGLREDVHRLYANPTPFCTRNLSTLD